MSDDDDRIWTNVMVLAARDNEIDALEAKLARADARIAELEADAARYRWLRTGANDGPYIVDWHGCMIAGEDADEYVDAARAGNGEHSDARTR